MMMHRSFLPILSVVLCATAAAFEPDKIVLPESPSPVESHAAHTLAKYIRLVSGKELEVVNSCVPVKGAICVGPELAGKGLGPLPVLNEEESIGRSRDGILFLTGAEKNSRGTLYSVYEFLERELGVRFYTPLAEKIPRREKLDLSRVDFRFAPAFPLGRIILRLRPPDGMSLEQYDDFLSKSRISTVYGLRAVEEKFGPFWRTLPVDGDSMHIFVPASKYYKDHPEFFAWRDGKRQGATGRGGMGQPQVCFSNPELRRVLLEEVRNFWRQQGAPENTFLRITNNDNDRICQCADCEAVNREEGSHAGLYLRVVNWIAGEMKKEFPGIRILANAYWTTRNTPRLTRPAENVYLKFCDIEGTFSRRLDDPSDPVNRKIYQNIDDWNRAGGKLYATTYTTNFTRYLYPVNDYDTFPENLRIYHEHGALAFEDHSSWTIRGVDFEQWRYYRSARLMRDPSFDVHTGRREFFEFYYGPAAEAMNDYYELIRSAAKKHRYQTGCFFLFPSFYDRIFQQEADPIFQRAVKLCGGREPYSSRVAGERISLRFMELSSGTLFASYPEEKQKALLHEFSAECRRFGVLKRSNVHDDTIEKWVDERLNETKQVLLRPGVPFLVRPDLVSGGEKQEENGEPVVKMVRPEEQRIIRSYSAQYYTADPELRFDLAVKVKADFSSGAAREGLAFVAGWEPGFRNQPDGVEVEIPCRDLPDGKYADVPVARKIHARTAYSYFYLKPVFTGQSGIKSLLFAGFVLTPVINDVPDQNEKPVPRVSVDEDFMRSRLEDPLQILFQPFLEKTSFDKYEPCN